MSFLMSGLPCGSNVRLSCLTSDGSQDRHVAPTPIAAAADLPTPDRWGRHIVASISSAKRSAAGALDVLLTRMWPAALSGLRHSQGTTRADNLGFHFRDEGPTALALQLPKAGRS